MDPAQPEKPSPPSNADAAAAPHERSTFDWRRFVVSSAAVSLLTLAAKGLGFLEKLVLAHFGGASAPIDAYFTAFSVAFFLYVLIDDIVAPVFLARYVQARNTSDPRGAVRLTIQALALVAVVLALSVLAILLSPVSVLKVIAPGFDQEQLGWAVKLLRWTAPAGLLMGLAALTYVLLNAHQSFAWPALGGTVFKAGIVLGMLALMPSVGIVGAAAAILIAAVLQLALHAWGVARWVRPAEGSRIESSTRRSAAPSHLGPMFRLMAPLAVGTIVAQACSFVDNACASTLAPGSIAALGYARRLIDLPILLVPGVLAIVAFPRLAQWAVERDVPSMMNLTARIMSFCLIIFLPALVVFLFEAESTVRIVFARGRFDENSVTVTAAALAVYAFGLPAFAVEIPLLRTYYALQDTKTPTIVGIALVFVHVAIVLLLTFKTNLGVVVFPLALVVRKSLKVCILVWLLRVRAPGEWCGRFLRDAGRIALCAIVFGAVLLAAHRGLPLLGFDRFAGPAFGLVASIAAASAAYLVALAAAGLLRFVRLKLPSAS